MLHRWHPACSRFPPRAQTGVEVPLDVNAMNALHALIKHLDTMGQVLPQACSAWAAAYAKTIDSVKG